MQRVETVETMLYLPPPPDAGALARALEGMGGRAPCVLLDRADLTLRDVARAGEAAALLAGVEGAGAEGAAARGLDGAEVPALPAASLARAREALGKALSLGAHAGADRDAAIEAADAGCDYVVLSAQADEGLIAFWAAAIELPLVVECPTPEAARRWAGQVEFVRPPVSAWEDGFDGWLAAVIG